MCIGSKPRRAERLHAYNVEIMMVRIRKPDINGWINALKDGDVDVRRGAAETLGIIGDKRAVKPLMRVVQDEDEDGEVRQAAVCAVGRIGGKRAVESLIRVLVFSPTIRSVLIKPTGDESTIDISWDADGWVRRGAVKIGYPAVESSTRVPMDMDVRRAAGDALVEIGDPAIETLIYKLKGWRANATVALVKIGYPAVEPLIRTLEDKQVRQAVVDVLVEIGEPAVGALISALECKNWEVREGVINVLGKVGKERAVKPLINALGDMSVLVRWAAALALGKIGDEGAVEPLINAFEDTDALVRESVARALGEIGDARADEDVWVRKAATRALEIFNSRKNSKMRFLTEMVI
jgi:HEAT repeat protein